MSVKSVAAIDDALMCALEAAVPLWMLEFRDFDEGHRLRRARDVVDIVASQGDVIQFRSKRSGESAKAFNALAQGLAILAYQPGGVTFGGRHWCVEHSFGIACTSIADLTCGLAAPEPGPPQRRRPVEDAPDIATYAALGEQLALFDLGGDVA